MLLICVKYIAKTTIKLIGDGEVLQIEVGGGGRGLFFPRVKSVNLTKALLLLHRLSNIIICISRVFFYSSFSQYILPFLLLYYRYHVKNNKDFNNTYWSSSDASLGRGGGGGPGGTTYIFYLFNFQITDAMHSRDRQF